MKTKEKKFDAVKLMRELREKIDKEIAHLTPEQVVEYFRKSKELFEKSISVKVS